MIGPAYWTTGISVSYRTDAAGQHTWKASLAYCDDGFATDDLAAGKVSTEGALATRYHVAEDPTADHADNLLAIVQKLWDDAQRLGIIEHPHEAITMGLYADHDGAYEPHGSHALTNQQFRDTVTEVVNRLGWIRGLPDEDPTD